MPPRNATVAAVVRESTPSLLIDVERTPACSARRFTFGAPCARQVDGRFVWGLTGRKVERLLYWYTLGERCTNSAVPSSLFQGCVCALIVAVRLGRSLDGHAVVGATREKMKLRACGSSSKIVQQQKTGCLDALSISMGGASRTLEETTGLL